MAVNVIVERRATERRFFYLVSLAFPLIVLFGFGRTYYLKPLFASPPVPSMLVHLHGLLMTAWIALFMTQVWLISTRRVKVHQQLGIAGAALGAVMIPVGIATAVAAAKYGSNSFPPGFPPRAFMIVPFFDMLLFTLFFGGAIYYRKSPAEHKRLILLTILNFLPPAIARFPIGFVTAAGPLAFFGITDLLAITFLIGDARSNGRLNKVLLWGTVVLIASQPLRIMLSGTAVWLRFATWLTT